MAYLRLFIMTVTTVPLDALDTLAFFQDCDRNANKRILLLTVSLLSCSCLFVFLSFVFSLNNPRYATVYELINVYRNIPPVNTKPAITRCIARHSQLNITTWITNWQLSRTVHYRRKSTSTCAYAIHDLRSLVRLLLRWQVTTRWPPISYITY